MRKPLNPVTSIFGPPAVCVLRGSEASRFEGRPKSSPMTCRSPETPRSIDGNGVALPTIVSPHML